MKDKFKSIISSFHEKLPLPNITERELSIPLDSKQIITLIGPRRCGKTYYFYSLINKLLKKSINKRNILYFNFEDERFDFSVGEMQSLVDAYFELYPEIIDKELYFFFDEIQEVENWEKFIRRMKDTFTVHIFITGSSSKMLSSDIATALRGRSITYNLYPFSFSEYCLHNAIPTNELHSIKNKTQLYAFFQDFLVNGGYPEVSGEADDIKRKILQSYFNVMLYKDIIERYQVSNNLALKQFIKQLAATISSEFSINKIYNDLKSNHIQVSKNQLYNFLEYIQDCSLFFLHHPLEFSIRKSLKARKKTYFIDNGLLNNITPTFSNNFGALLENLIFIELIRREKEIYFFRNGSECDFVVQENNIDSQYIQVCYDIANEETLNREMKSLINLYAENPESELLIITNSVEKILTKNGISIKLIPAWKWCLQKT